MPHRSHLWIALLCFALGLLCLSGIACLGSSGSVRTTPNEPASTLHLDPQFDAEFYREFALGQTTVVPGIIATGLTRQRVPPAFYINTHDIEGAPVPQSSIEATAHAIATTLPLLTGGWQTPLIAYGPMPANAGGTVEVKWDTQTETAMGGGIVCGNALIGGQTLALFYQVPECVCNGVISALMVKHELGHILGFHHIQEPGLMSPFHSACADTAPSAREQFHGRVAYSRPIGSMEPK